MFPSVKLVKTDKGHTFSEGLCTRTLLETHDFAVAVLVGSDEENILKEEYGISIITLNRTGVTIWILNGYFFFQ